MGAIATYGKIAVVDVERTCWPPGKEPENFEPEIIQVGVVLLSAATLELSRPRRIYIMPKQGALAISAYCQTLTGISPSCLSGRGKTVAEAAQILKQEFKLDRRVFAGWGRDDTSLRPLIGEGAPYLNLGALYSMYDSVGGRSVGLNQALERCGLPPNPGGHDAGFDALSAARVFRLLLEHARGLAFGARPNCTEAPT